MIWIPLLSAVLYAGAIAHIKWLVNRTKIELGIFLPLLFVFLFLGASSLMPWFGQIDYRLGEPRNAILVIILAAVAFSYNLFLMRGLRRETIHEYELNDLLLPIVTIGLAALVFSDERDGLKLILAGVATATFLLLHLKHSHLAFKHADRWLIFAVFLMAIEAILVKPLLEVVDPISLYAIRTGLIALTLLFIFRPRFDHLPLSIWGEIILNAMVGVAAMTLRWTAIHRYGIVATELVLMATPIVLAIISLFLLKERWTLKQGIAFAVILGCIAISSSLP